VRRCALRTLGRLEPVVGIAVIGSDARRCPLSRHCPLGQGLPFLQPGWLLFGFRRGGLRFTATISVFQHVRRLLDRSGLPLTSEESAASERHRFERPLARAGAREGVSVEHSPDYKPEEIGSVVGYGTAVDYRNTRGAEG
jgi:hypothetical protein